MTSYEEAPMPEEIEQLTPPAAEPVDADPDPAPEQVDAMLHAMVWGSGTEYYDSITCGHPRTDHDEDGCNRPFCGCNWGTDEFSGQTCGRSLAERRAGL